MASPKDKLSISMEELGLYASYSEEDARYDQYIAEQKEKLGRKPRSKKESTEIEESLPEQQSFEVDYYDLFFREVWMRGGGVSPRDEVSSAELDIIDDVILDFDFNDVDGALDTFQDRVETDVVLVAERFPQRVAAVQTQRRCILGVDAVLGRAAGMAAAAFIGEDLGDNAVKAVLAGKVVIVVVVRVDHQRQIHAVEIAAAHEFRLAAQVFDLSLVDESLAELQLDHLFRRDQHKTDLAAETVQCAGLFESRCDADHLRALAVVTAAVRHAVDGFRVIRDVQRIQFAHDGQAGTGSSCVDVYIESGNIPRFHRLIPVGAEFLQQIRVRLPLGVAYFRMLPDPALRV